MKYVTLGSSDLSVSKVCLGCMGFVKEDANEPGWGITYEEAKPIIQRALESGINFFDTSMGYGNGSGERILGRILEECTKRDKVVIATKFLPMKDEDAAAGMTTQGYIENCLNASLERLRTDYIDLYIYHIWDFKMKMEDVMEGLHRVVSQGKVKYIGISNCFAYQLALCNEIAKRNGWEEFISIQGHYNLIFREEEREMVRYCRENNIAMTPYSALAAGRLAKRPGEITKRMAQDTMAKSKYDDVLTKDIDNQIIGRVIEIADKRGVSMSEVSLAWLMKKTASPVCGATRPEQIDGMVKATELELTDEEIQYLEELYVPHKLVGVMSWYKMD